MTTVLNLQHVWTGGFKEASSTMTLCTWIKVFHKTKYKNEIINMYRTAK
jgi:hypothetical protein